MNDHPRHSTLRHVLKIIALIDLAVFMLVALLNWLGGWTSAYQYGDRLVVAGALVLGLGMLTVIGSWTGNRNFTYAMSESAGEQKIAERTERAAKYTVESFSSLLVVALAGLVPILVGILLQALFK